MTLTNPHGSTLDLANEPESLAEAKLPQSDACIGCGGRERRSYFPRALPWVQRCTHCDLVQTYPQPTDAELAEIYGPTYYTAFGHDSDADHSYHEMKRASAAALLERVEQQTAVGRLLDVGSALGDLMLAARARGWEVDGLEPNQFAVDQADKELPGRTFCGNIDEFDTGDLPWAPQSFDVITCCDTIEHLRRPDAFARQAAFLLKPGGLLVVTTIDVDSWSSKLLGSRWVHYHRDHLWYFNRRTLSTVAGGAGLDVLCSERARKIFDANYLLSIIRAGKNFAAARWVAACGLRLLPQWALRKQFRLSEGLLLIARKPAQ